jgi:hypothetical protein
VACENVGVHSSRRMLEANPSVQIAFIREPTVDRRRMTRFSPFKGCLPASGWYLACLTLQPCRWRRHVSLKRQLIFNGMHGIVSQEELYNHPCENLKSCIIKISAPAFTIIYIYTYYRKYIFIYLYLFVYLFIYLLLGLPYVLIFKG